MATGRPPTLSGAIQIELPDMPSSDTKDVYVYGAGGHARVVIDVLEDMGLKARAQFTDDDERVHPATINAVRGIRLTGVDSFGALDGRVVVAIGRNDERKEIVALLEQAAASSGHTIDYVTAVHSTATVAKTALIGEGTVVIHRAIIQPNTVIGRHVLINTGASIDHDNVIGDFAHISPNTTLSGHVEVGEGTHIGAGATVIPSVKIGRWCTIGAGSVVLSDVPDFATAVGVPAKIIKQA